MKTIAFVVVFFAKFRYFFLSGIAIWTIIVYNDICQEFKFFIELEISS